MEHLSGAPPVQEGVDRLCGSCVQLPMTEDDVNHSGGVEYYIGTLSEIRMRPGCPMCRLLVAAYLNDPQYTRLERNRKGRGSDAVSVVWQARRKGFTYSLGSVGVRLSFVRNGDESTWGQGRRIHTHQIDTNLIHNWLRRCQQEHGKHCEAEGRTVKDATSTLLNPPSRLIDVRRRCIIEVESVSVYVTLSYVWGNVRKLQLLKENRQSLLKPFALDLLSLEIPNTITDAIDLVARLGFPYLWIDALCIVQDDERELAREIEHMDLIYENSLFTIIAAHGVDADAGLMGVQPNSRQAYQLIEQVGPDTSLVALYELDDVLRNPVYSTRGWTFQQRILSRRNVVFVKGQVYFQCQLRTWSEDTCYEDKASNATPENIYGSVLPAALSQESSPRASFIVLMMYYSERELTYDSDALKAAAGLLRMLATRMGCENFQGIPNLNFDAYLLFYPTSTVSTRRRRPQLPSYTWAGWKGRVDWFDYSFFIFSNSFNCGEPADWVREHTWICWYELSPDGTARSISDIPKVAADRSTLKSAARARLQKQLPCITQDFKQTAATIDMSKLGRPCPYPFLAFWTVSIHLMMIAAPDAEDLEKPTFELWDKGPSFCGYVWCDELLRQTPTEPLEFILLSETDYERADFLIPGEIRHSNRSGYYYGDEVHPEEVKDRWDYYWAMLIEWDHGIAERRGIGQIYKNAAEKSFPPGPVWKQIVLA